MKAGFIISTIAIAVIGTLTGAGFLIRDHFHSQELPSYGKAPRFELQDMRAGVFSSTTLQGKPYVINFFFSHCQAVCPTTNAAMARIARDTAVDAAQFLSISVDPERDTPEVLQTYADKFKANPRQWSFLTGPKQEVDRMLNEFKLGASENIAEHTSRLVLVDKNSEVRGYYPGTEEDAIDSLQRDLQRLLRH